MQTPLQHFHIGGQGWPQALQFRVSLLTSVQTPAQHFCCPGPMQILLHTPQFWLVVLGVPYAGTEYPGLRQHFPPPPGIVVQSLLQAPQCRGSDLSLAHSGFESGLQQVSPPLQQFSEPQGTLIGGQTHWPISQILSWGQGRAQLLQWRLSLSVSTQSRPRPSVLRQHFPPGTVVQSFVQLPQRVSLTMSRHVPLQQSCSDPQASPQPEQLYRSPG